jgi:predicted GIY-YIG superfamily endonuclease
VTGRPSAAELLETPATVYVARSASGIVLYVGITGARIHRLHAHARSSEWWRRAASVELIHLPTRREAEELEASLIRELAARFNVKHGLRSADESEPDPGPQLLDLEGLRQLGLSSRAARTILRSLPTVRRGRRRYVRRCDFVRYVGEHTRTSAGSA